MEELISQDDRLGRIHPQSVNTVRVPTIRLNDRTILFHPFFRVGRGESVVDNAGSGGIICALDSKTGTVIAAADEHGNKFTVHPDTKEKLIGFEIPEWDKAVEFVEALVKVVPSNRYTGWDIALTNEGWILIEANARGQWVAQIPLQQGFRKEYMQYMQELNL